MQDKEYDIINYDNTEYVEIDKIDFNNNTYVFLSEYENPNNFCIKILLEDNGKEYYKDLNSKEEFNIALNLFNEKYTN